ncbi:MAG: DUF5103 domain-containing protein, partial [Cyclobacteriaceae bacterium]
MFKNGPCQPIRQILILSLFIVTGCLPLESTVGSSGTTVAKRLIYDNYIYDENVKTVRLYNQLNSYDNRVQPAAVPLQADYRLMLEFDKLRADYENLYAKIVHCDFDWTPSQLRDQEFLVIYNEFPISDYEYSRASRIPYTHYTVELPKVKVPGNYLVKVYRDGKEEDLMLSRRFLVYENRVQLEADVGLSSGIAERTLNQQVNFSVGYANLSSSNPLEEVKVMVRQNKRWDNALLLQPTFVNEVRKVLEYKYFNLENNFPAGNEFRFFDLRAINSVGQNIGAIDKKDDRVDAFVLKDKGRAHEAYGSYNDINGEYVIRSLETDPAKITAEYVYTHFFLLSEQKLPEDVFIFGALTNWRFDNSSKLTYDTELRGYTGTLLLKQGWYNYLYLIKDPKKSYYFEGNNYETENQYEILVYYRPIGSISDQLIGYFPL